MTEKNKQYDRISWYEKEKYSSYTLIDLKESNIAENDPTAPRGALNCMEIFLQKNENNVILRFYNYRIERKDFEFIPPKEITWHSDEIYIQKFDRFYLDVFFLLSSGRIKKLEFSFENSEEIN